MRPDLVGQNEAGILVEHPVADGAERILVTQFSMDAFPDTETEVGANAEIVWTVGVGIGDFLRDLGYIWKGLDHNLIQLIDVGDFANVREIFCILAPM